MFVCLSTNEQCSTESYGDWCDTEWCSCGAGLCHVVRSQDISWRYESQPLVNKTSTLTRQTDRWTDRLQPRMGAKVNVAARFMRESTARRLSVGSKW